MRDESSGSGIVQKSKTVKMDFKQLGAEEEDEWVRVEILMPRSLLTKIDVFREEWGVKSRGSIVAGLLQELLSDEPID